MTAPSTRPSNKGMGCAVLFLAPFAAFGVTMAVITAWCVVDWVRMQRWVETPARLISLDLEGDDTDRIDAQYEYTFAGQQYTGTRVALHSGSDNIGSYQARNFKRLQQTKMAGKVATVYVNPNNPSEAVLLRDLRPEMIAFKGIFALVFGLIGVGGMVGAVYVTRDAKREIALAEKHPDEPWRWRRDWSEGVITSAAYGGVIAVAIFAGIWNLGVWGATWAVFASEQPPSIVATGVMLLFVVVGLGMIVWAGVYFIRWRRFPRATFRMASTPGVVGGQLAGVVLVPGVVRPEEGFRIRLTCVERINSKDDAKDRLLWEDERTVVRTLDEDDPMQTAVPVAFTIPYGAETSDPHAQRKVTWKLQVAAKLTGPDLAFDFEVPVFYTPDSRDDVSPEAEPLTEFERPTESLEALLAAERIQVDQGAAIDSVVYRVPPARRPGICLSFTLFTVVWNAVVIGLFYFRIWLFAAAFGLFGVLLALLTLHTWLAWSELRVCDGQWQYRWGWWPLWFATRQFDNEQIRGFEVKQNTQVGTKSYGDVICKLRDGKSITLASMLGSRVAELVWTDDLRRRAGME